MYREKQHYSGDLGLADATGRFLDAINQLSWPKKLGIGCLSFILIWMVLGMLFGSGGGARGISGAELKCRTSSSGIQTCSARVGFDQCLDIIRRTADELGVAPINIVETTEMRMVRFPASDGSVILTCSPDGQMGVTRSHS